MGCGMILGKLGKGLWSGIGWTDNETRSAVMCGLDYEWGIGKNRHCEIYYNVEAVGNL